MDTHAHEYQVGDSIVAPDWWIREIGDDVEAAICRDEGRVSVAKVVAELGAPTASSSIATTWVTTGGCASSSQR